MLNYSTHHTHTHTHTQTHTPNQGKSIKSIDLINRFPYNVIFLLYFVVFYYILHYSLRNYIYSHIYQHFTITTHHYIVFYHFNNT